MQLSSPSPLARRVIAYGAVGLVVLGCVVLCFLPTFGHKPSWEEVSATITQVSRSTLPKQVGGATLVEIRPGKPWEFNYRYVVDEETAETARDPAIRETFAALMRRQHEDKYRDSTTQSMALIRRLGITCIHRYEDAKGGLVIEVRVGPEALR